MGSGGGGGGECGLGFFSLVFFFNILVLVIGSCSRLADCLYSEHEIVQLNIKIKLRAYFLLSFR